MPTARPLAVLLAALLVLAPAAALSTAAAASAKPRPAATSEARIGGRGFGRSGRGGIFGRRRPSVRRPAVRRPVHRRPLFRHGFFGSVLRALGIAYLVHLLFGWGPGGGSPLGLLLVVAVVLRLATRRRRRGPVYW